MAGARSAQIGVGILGDPRGWFGQDVDGFRRWADRAVAASRDAMANAAKTAQDVWSQAGNAASQGAKALGIGPENYDPDRPDASRDIDDGFAARGLGNVLGVGRGVVHSAEGMGQSIGFAARLLNPLDYALSAPGQSAYDQTIDGVGRAAQSVTQSVARGLADPASVVAGAQKAMHQARLDLDPSATPVAATLYEEFLRNLKIGENQGKFGFGLGTFLIGDGLLAGAAGLGRTYKATTAAEFMAQGFSPAVADHLAAP